MKLNVAGQEVGVQMVSASTGAAFTGSVTASVTGDAGSQATGSVSAGACTHKGNGYHVYAPAQAETNFTHVAFTFTGTGATPATVQIYTSFPQTGDNYARIGAPAGASISADVAAIKSDTAAVKAKTDNLPAAPAATSDCITAAGVRTATGLASANLDTQLSAIAGYIDTEVAAIKAKTDNLPASPAATSDVLTAAQVRSAVGLASANLDTQIGTLATSTTASAIKTKTDQLAFGVTNQLDVNVESINTAAVLGVGTSGDKWRGS